MLVDGHRSHIDLEVSKFCSENQILLYCLPPHSSHLLQPLDVGFFRSLKVAWGKECNRYRAKEFGSSVTRETFSYVFREAWFSCVRPSIFVSAFRESGICPFNPTVVDHKLGPSLPYSSYEESQQPVDNSAANKKLDELSKHDEAADSKSL